MFGNIGTTEILIIAFLILVLFGGNSLPAFGRGLAEAINEFKAALSDPLDENPEVAKVLASEDLEEEEGEIDFPEGSERHFEEAIAHHGE